MATVLYIYHADVGFVTDIPARDITDADSEDVIAIALANSLTSYPCYTAA